MSDRIATTRITLEAIGELLDLPEGVHVHGVEQDASDRFNGTTTIMLVGDALPANCKRLAGQYPTPIALADLRMYSSSHEAGRKAGEKAKREQAESILEAIKGEG